MAAEDLYRELVGMQVQGCDQLEGRTLHSLAFQVLISAHALAATDRTARPLNEFEMQPLLADLAGEHDGKRNVKKRIKAFEAAWVRLQSDEPGYMQSHAGDQFWPHSGGILNRRQFTTSPSPGHFTQQLLACSHDPFPRRKVIDITFRQQLAGEPGEVVDPEADPNDRTTGTDRLVGNAAVPIS